MLQIRTKRDMELTIKICGISSVDALEAAIVGGADLLGFVFFPASPRHLSAELARELEARVRGRAGKVALSVDADDATLAEMVQFIKPDMLQLHGDESPQRVAAVRSRFGLPVAKAIAVASAADVESASVYRSVADHLVFDARPPREATRPGGLGRAFDWRLLQGMDTPFMLSGGLDATNVAEALAITRANGVDVSSGVERAPGEKDPDRIREFIATARRAARALSEPVPSGA